MAVNVMRTHNAVQRNIRDAPGWCILRWPGLVTWPGAPRTSSFVIMWSMQVKLFMYNFSVIDSAKSDYKNTVMEALHIKYKKLKETSISNCVHKVPRLYSKSSYNEATSPVHAWITLLLKRTLESGNWSNGTDINYKMKTLIVGYQGVGFYALIQLSGHSPNL